MQGREEILRVHINQRGLPLGDDVRVDQLAAQVGALGCCILLVSGVGNEQLSTAFGRRRAGGPACGAGGILPG